MRASERHHLVELRIGRGLEGTLEPGRVLDAEREARALPRLEQPAARRNLHLVTQMEDDSALPCWRYRTVKWARWEQRPQLGQTTSIVSTAIVSKAIASIAIASTAIASLAPWAGR